MDTYEVIGPCKVAGVAKGGTVELDPSAVNIDALVAARHIRPTSRPVFEPLPEVVAGDSTLRTSKPTKRIGGDA